MKKLLLALIFSFISSVALGQITVPNTFVPGTTASATQVNANFSALGTNALNRSGGSITGNITVDPGVTVDGVDISEILGGGSLDIDSGSIIGSTGPQLVIGYDPAHALNITIDQNGNGIFDLIAPGAIFTFKDPVVFEAPITVSSINCSGCITPTNLAPIPEEKIIDGTILARVSANEAITGQYTFSNYTIFSHSVVVFQSPSTGANTRNWAIHTPTSTFQILTLNDGLGGISAGLTFIRDAAGGIPSATIAATNIAINGATTVNGSLAATGNIRSTTGHYLQSDGSLGLYMVGTQIQMFSDAYYFTNKANTAQAMTLTGAGALNVAASVTSGTSIHAGTSIHPGTFISIPSGDVATPSIRFNDLADSGIYYNTAVAPNGQSVDFGSHFSSNTMRALLRARTDGPVVQLMTAGVIPFEARQDRIIVGPNGPIISVLNGVVVPAANNAYSMGSSFPAYWTAIYAINGTIQTSDIDLKEIRGPLTGVLDTMDLLAPQIAIWKKGVIKDKKYDPSKDAFPTFSAQDVGKILDTKFGTRIAQQNEDGSWAMNYARLTPVLWQGTRELNAKVKALEAKVEAQYLALAALEMKVNAHKH